MEEKRIRVAIAHGDTNGIGYELIFKTFATPEMLEMCTPVIYGSPKIAAYHRNSLNIQANFSIINDTDDALEGRLNLLTCFENDVKVELGLASKESEQAGYRALERAVADYKSGKYDVLVMAPMTPAADSKNPQQTTFVAQKLGEEASALTVLLSNDMRVAILADNVSMSELDKHISKETIVEKAKTLHTMLKRDLRISNPRIAILALNPDGNGREETECIIPAVSQLAEQSIQAFGPYVADNFFGSGAYTNFDAVLAMYHDQGVAPLKTLSADRNILYMAGMSLVCTMPSFDPMFAITGKGVADEQQLRQAVYTAIDAVRNRKNYDEPLANPLPKLYKERRDDSEKVRFTIPKKHDNNAKEPEKQKKQDDNKNA